MDPLAATDVGQSLDSVVDVVVAFGADFFAFIVLAAVIFGMAFYFGRDRLLALMAAVYAAVVLYQTFPYTSWLPEGNAWVQIGLYLVFLIAGWVAFSGLSYFLSRSDTEGFLGTAILSAATAGILIAIGVHVLPVTEIYTFSAPTLALFQSEEAFFLWLLAPLAALFAFGK